jgi:XTP/dITP diphosphohydrolase
MTIPPFYRVGTRVFIDRDICLSADRRQSGKRLPALGQLGGLGIVVAEQRPAEQDPLITRPLLVLATLNLAKGREIAALLADVPFTLRLLADWPGATLPEETGASYAANALLKARAAARQVGALALADDSGLEVDALGGGPGLRSARYGGPGLDDAARRQRLLDALADVPAARRTARFRCVIALVDPAGPEHLHEAVAEGVILDAPRGRGGFGYDPLFFYPPLGRTFAELSEAEKGAVSHRGQAVAAVRRRLAGCYTRHA